VPEVRVVDDTGGNLGVMETIKAIQIAKEKGLDLIEVSAKAQPPVCRIMNYGKYQYAEEKKERKQKAKQKRVELKEIRIGFTTSVHDSKIRAKQIDEFLKENHKVKIELKLKGREKAHKDLAKEKLNNFLSMISVEFKQEEEIKNNPYGIVTIICLGKAKNQ
jgi:translation initiation factor IF-3